MRITLSGLGTFNDDPSDRATLKTLNSLCKQYGAIIYPTYYDHTLEGDRDTIEKITLEVWGMPADEWSDNGLIEEAQQ